MNPSPREFLSVKDLCKFYGEFKALDGVDFVAYEGEFLGLLGPNGAGKTTLFQVLCGLFAPDRGQVEIFGGTYQEKSSSILTRLGVVFQSRSVDLDMTILENLRFHGRLYGIGKHQLSDRIDQLASMFDLADLLTRPVRNLSGGQQRKVEIARAMINEPDLLFMDEPTAGLDTVSRGKLVKELHDLVHTIGMTLLWSTHLVDEVETADRIIVMNKGRVVAQNTPAAIIKSAGAENLVDAYTALTGAKPQS